MNIDEIVVPDRYEVLAQSAKAGLKDIVEKIPASLAQIRAIGRKISTANRGAFLILRGDSGTGKSTFLHTLPFFLEDIEVFSVPGSHSIQQFLLNKKKSKGFTVFVLEEREALVSFSDKELETWLHEINGFCRSSAGKNCLVVWPCNTDELRDRLVDLAKAIGGKALTGGGVGWHNFIGPEKEKWPRIATKTLGLANQGASLADVGMTSEQLETLKESSDTLGDYFSDIQDIVQAAQGEVENLVEKEQCRLWVLVLAGNEPAAEISGLTRGVDALIDTARLMSATEANIVSELKKYPEKIGIVGTVLDARVTYLPVLSVTSIIRAFASNTLKARLKVRGFALSPAQEHDAIERLRKSEFGKLLKGASTDFLPRGKKLGSKSREAFEKLADIASANDHELNKCIGDALKKAKIIKSYELEQDFGEGLTRRTDLVCKIGDETIRVECMWRKTTSRADIANYTLTKVNNYAKAIGFIV